MHVATQLHVEYHWRHNIFKRHSTTLDDSHCKHHVKSFKPSPSETTNWHILNMRAWRREEVLSLGILNILNSVTIMLLTQVRMRRLISANHTNSASTIWSAPHLSCGPSHAVLWQLHDKRNPEIWLDLLISFLNANNINWSLFPREQAEGSGDGTTQTPPLRGEGSGYYWAVSLVEYITTRAITIKTFLG